MSLLDDNKLAKALNHYEIKAVFFDEDGYFLADEIIKTMANSVEEAYDDVDLEIIENQECYPSDEFELELVDTY